MSVIVKGMKIPKNCLECKLKLWEYDEYYCPFSGISALCIGRQTDCPLVEIPPHGRLIDADAIPWENQTMTYDDEWAIKAYDLEQMPTVIEAEERI